MGKVHVFNSVSLDGYFSGPNGDIELDPQGGTGRRGVERVRLRERVGGDGRACCSAGSRTR